MAESRLPRPKEERHKRYLNPGLEPIKYRGTMGEDGKSLSGTWTLPSGLSGTWTARLSDDEQEFHFQRTDEEELAPAVTVRTERG